MASARQLRAGKAIIELSLLSGPVEKKLRRLHGMTKRLGSAFTAIGTLGGSRGGGGSFLYRLLVGSAISSAILWPVKLAADLEAATAEFTTFTGSAHEAQRVLKWIQDFATKTPYNIGELQKAARTMLSFGVAAKDVTGALEAVGNIAAGNTERLDRLAVAFGQSASKGRLQAEEVRQYVNAGFNPLQEIARTTGESIGEVTERMKAGNVTFQEVGKAFITATKGGGRFNGLLERFSRTLKGQIGIFKEAFNVAIRPLGEEMLPTLKQFFGTLNKGLPVFAAFVKRYASYARPFSIGLALLVGGMATFVAVGITFQVIALAAYGMAMAVSLATAAFSAIFTVTGSLIIALASLANWFFTATDNGRQMVKNLAGWFADLLSVARDTFTGIADALAAGQFELAGKVGMAGLNAAWAEGTDDLRKTWSWFREFFLRSTTNMVFDMQEAFTNAVADIQRAWQNVKLGSTVFGEWAKLQTLLQFGSGSATSKFNAGMAALNNITQAVTDAQAKIDELEKKRQEALDAITASRGIVDEDLTRAHEKRLREIEEEKRKALEMLKELQKEAAKAPKLKGLQSLENLANFAQLGKGVATGGEARSLFDTRFAAQVFGRGSGIEERQLKEQVLTNKQLRQMMELIEANPGLAWE